MQQHPLCHCRQTGLAPSRPRLNLLVLVLQIIHVQNENQAREWSVALGNSVTFIDDNRPYCYTKSMGMSQLEPPVFKRFRLEEETDDVAPQPAPSDSSAQIDMSLYMTKSEFEPFKAIIEDMQSIAKELRGIE